MFIDSFNESEPIPLYISLIELRGMFPKVIIRLSSKSKLGSTYHLFLSLVVSILYISSS